MRNCVEVLNATVPVFVQISVHSILVYFVQSSIICESILLVLLF